MPLGESMVSYRDALRGYSCGAASIVKRASMRRRMLIKKVSADRNRRFRLLSPLSFSEYAMPSGATPIFKSKWHCFRNRVSQENNRMSKCDFDSEMHRLGGVRWPAIGDGTRK
jgi:hypothetical protein